MRKRDGNADRFQIPVMFAFRDAFDAKDARKRIEERRDGEKVISGRGSLKRRGADETMLKRNLAVDLLALVNTVDLASAVDLEDFEHVGRSVLNFGLRDVAHLTSQEIGVESLARDLSAALVNHEPRLDPESLQIVRDGEFDDVNQRIRYTVSAEMACTPLDVPIEFVAEIDIGSGKVQLTRLPVST
jgi:type VI secretion system protein ImpF